MSTLLWRSHNGLTHPTPSGELTAKLSQFLNKWEVPHNRGIIDGISSIFYRINVSCFVLMKAYFIISIFLMTLNSVYVYRFSESKVEKRVSTNKSRRNDKNKFFAFLLELLYSVSFSRDMWLFNLIDKVLTQPRLQLRSELVL